MLKQLLGSRFFVPGHRYRRITPRPDTQHTYNEFETGDELLCISVTPAYSGRELMYRSGRIAYDFQRDHLTGVFERVSDGVQQVLSVGDVKKCQN